MTTEVEQLRTDEYLGPIVAKVGPRRIDPDPAFFPRFVRSIVRQQVSMSAAASIEERLRSSIELTPAVVAQTEPGLVQEAGLSTQKAETVVRVADRVASGDWSRDAFADLSDQEAIAELTTVRGVGVWTAKMQLMFSLGREDVFPVEDLGIRRGMQTLIDEELSRAEMVEFAERWRPVRTRASLYLWEVSD